MSLKLNLDNIFTPRNKSPSPVRGFEHDDTILDEQTVPIGQMKERLPLHVTYHNTQMLKAKIELHKEKVLEEQEHTFTPHLNPQTRRLAHKRQKQNGKSQLHIDHRLTYRREEWKLGESSMIMRQSPKRKNRLQTAKARIASFLERQQSLKLKSQAMRKMAWVIQDQQTRHPC